MSYKPLTVEQFGRKMITTGDLDPIYIALGNLQMPITQKYRWMVAYWCFYHAGFASYASEHDGQAFWNVMKTAAENVEPCVAGGRWPRGSERRHFRGGQGMRATLELADKYQSRPGDMVLDIAHLSRDGSGKRPVGNVFREVQKFRGFGDWISFKVADMLDCCTEHSVTFDNAHVFMFSDPIKGANLAYDTWWNHASSLSGISEPPPFLPISERPSYVVQRLIKEFSGMTAPPRHTRKINVQEVETVLCKWKGHVAGRHPVGNDTVEIHHGLKNWFDVSYVAQQFAEAMPSVALFEVA